MSQQPKLLTAAQLLDLRAFEASYQPALWAKAILQHIKHRSRKRGEALNEMEDFHIEALAAFQGYCCTVSGIEFVLPEDAELKKERGYTKWLNSLAPIDRARAPFPVRAEPDEPWGPGNMLLLSEGWSKVYELSSTSVSFHQAVLDVMNRIKEHQFVIMTAEEYPDALINLMAAKRG